MTHWTDEDVYLVATRGHNLFLQGRYAEAAVIFDGLRAIRPGDPYCANALAALYINLGQIEPAVDVLTETLSIHPEHLETRARRCEALVMLGRLAEARKDAEFLKRITSNVTMTRLEILLGAPKEFSPLKQLSSAGLDN